MLHNMCFLFAFFWYTQKGGRIAVEKHRFKTIHLEMGRVPDLIISDWNDLLMIFPNHQDIH